MEILELCAIFFYIDICGHCYPIYFFIIALFTSSFGHNISLNFIWFYGLGNCCYIHTYQAKCQREAYFYCSQAYSKISYIVISTQYCPNLTSWRSCCCYLSLLDLNCIEIQCGSGENGWGGEIASTAASGERVESCLHRASTWKIKRILFKEDSCRAKPRLLVCTLQNTLLSMVHVTFGPARLGFKLEQQIIQFCELIFGHCQFGC